MKVPAIKQESHSQMYSGRASAELNEINLNIPCHPMGSGARVYPDFKECQGISNCHPFEWQYRRTR